MISDDDLLRMANEAGLTDTDLDDWMIDYGNAEGAIKKFAGMVAAKEREICQQIASSELQNTSVLYSSPLQSSAAYNIEKRIACRTWFLK